MGDRTKVPMRLTPDSDQGPLYLREQFHRRRIQYVLYDAYLRGWLIRKIRWRADSALPLVWRQNQRAQKVSNGLRGAGGLGRSGAGE